jgi:O-antigen/teichoic acid export membrane protein
LVIIVIPLNLFAFRWALPAVADMPAQPAYRAESWVRKDFAGYMFWLLGTSPLPFLVLGFLGPDKAAGFYIPLTVATAVDVVTLNVGNAITAEVTRSGGRVDRHAARFIAGYWLLVLVGSLVLIFVAPTALSAFGRHYRSGSGVVLRMLLAASAARAAMFLTNALARSQGRGGRILLLQAVASVLTLGIGLATMLHLGTKGMALGWLIGSLCAGVLSLRWFAPVLKKAVSRQAPQVAAGATAK